MNDDDGARGIVNGLIVALMFWFSVALIATAYFLRSF